MYFDEYLGSMIGFGLGAQSSQSQLTSSILVTLPHGQPCEVVVG